MERDCEDLVCRIRFHPQCYGEFRETLLVGSDCLLFCLKQQIYFSDANELKFIGTCGLDAARPYCATVTLQTLVDIILPSVAVRL